MGEGRGGKLLRIEVVAEMLGVSRARCYELARKGLLPAIRLGRQLRVDPVRLDAWLAAGGSPLPGGWREEAE